MTWVICLHGTGHGGQLEFRCEAHRSDGANSADLDVEEDELLPVRVLLGDPDEARDVDARAEKLQVLHQLLGPVLGVQDAQLWCAQEAAVSGTCVKREVYPHDRSDVLPRQHSQSNTYS